MGACAAADVPFDPALKAANDFHFAAKAAATTVGFGGAAPSYYQPEAPDVYFTKMAHLNQMNAEAIRNTGGYSGAFPYHLGAPLRKKRQVAVHPANQFTADLLYNSVDLNRDGQPDKAVIAAPAPVAPLAYSIAHPYAYGAYPYHFGAAGHLALRKKRQVHNPAEFVNDYHRSSVDLNQDGQPDNRQFAYPYAYGAYPYQYGAYPYVY